jgi:hypothetical protein
MQVAKEAQANVQSLAIQLHLVEGAPAESRARLREQLKDTWDR